jgi:dCTP deaminase
MAAGALVLKPRPPEEAIQASSVDLRLGRHFRVYDSIGPDIDPFAPPEMHLVTPNEGTAFRLQPQQFVLGHTEEFVTLGDGLAGQVDGKSTLGRLGLLVHCTAGFIDPGFTGQVTLEFYNAAPRPILLWPGMQVCQLVLHRVSSTVTRPYGSDGLGSRYQNSIGAVPPRGDYIRLREPA